MTHIFRHGWNRQPKDPRDRKLVPPPQVYVQTECLLKGMPPIVDQGNLGSCVPPGTLIHMADGSERPIEDVRLGEYVVTAEGNTGMVQQAMLRTETSSLVKLALWGHYQLRLTSNHPILTKRGYVPAGDIRLDDFIALPRYRPAKITEAVKTSDLITKKENFVKNTVRHMGGVRGRADIAVLTSAVPETIALTPRFGRLLGLFLAEGSTSSGKAIWTFSIDEENTLVAETVDLLTDLGVEGHVQKRPNNSINVVVYGTCWSRFWGRLCGNGAGNKGMRPNLLSGSAEFLQSVLDGWLAGDGYHNKSTDGRRDRTVGSSVSKSLAMNMYDIAQALGHRPCLTSRAPVMNKYAATRRHIYFVEINSRVADADYRSSIDDLHVWRKVRQLESEEYLGPVYNLSVEGDESYVAEGVGVHNCTAHGSLAAFEFCRFQLGTVTQPLSRLQVYYDTRVAGGGDVTQDTGGVIRDAVKCLATTGAAPESMWPYNIDQFAVKPPQSVYDAALRMEALEYRAVDETVTGIKAALALGLPVIFGFNVSGNFMDIGADGLMPMPGPDIEGGHCVCAVGYSDRDYDDPTFGLLPAGHILVRNSWGPDWGRNGHFLMPYEVLAACGASDFWVVMATS